MPEQAEPSYCGASDSGESAPESGGADPAEVEKFGGDLSATTRVRLYDLAVLAAAVSKSVRGATCLAAERVRVGTRVETMCERSV